VVCGFAYYQIKSRVIEEGEKRKGVEREEEDKEERKAKWKEGHVRVKSICVCAGMSHLERKEERQEHAHTHTHTHHTQQKRFSNGSRLIHSINIIIGDKLQPGASVEVHGIQLEMEEERRG